MLLRFHSDGEGRRLRLKEGGKCDEVMGWFCSVVDGGGGEHSHSPACAGKV